MESIAELRKNYTRGELSEQDVPQEPFGLFQTWFESHARAVPRSARGSRAT